MILTLPLLLFLLLPLNSVLGQSTSDLHHTEISQGFTPKYAEARARLDYTYHKNYTLQRQELQDKIIDHFLSQGTVSSQPHLIFSSGPMAVGKSETLKHLDRSHFIKLEDYLIIDMDRIRFELPEAAEYFKNDPLTAGNRTQRESGLIQEILLNEALKAGKNIIVDSSLKNLSWTKALLAQIRKFHKNYLIAIFSIQADRDNILQRAALRLKKEGRGIPVKILEESILLSKASAKSLEDRVDCTYYFDNNQDIPFLTGGHYPSFEQWDKWREIHPHHP